MKAKIYIPFAIVVSLFTIHNFILNHSVVASEVIYLGYFLLAVIGSCITLVRSGLYGNRLTGKHTVSRFVASNIIAAALVAFVGVQGYQLSSDVINSRVVDGVFQVQSNLENIAGAFVLQQPDVRDGKQNVVSLTFLLRAQYLRVGEKYRLRYAMHSGYILTAEPIRFNNQTGFDPAR